MVARNEVAEPLNQHLLAVVTACVLQVPNLARQIPGVDVAQPELLPIAFGSGAAQARAPSSIALTSMYHRATFEGVVNVG